MTSTVGCRELYKQAAGTAEEARANAVGKIIGLGLTGVGAGALARTMTSLQSFNRPDYEMPFVSPGPSVLQVPVFQRAKRREDGQSLEKVAAGASDWYKRFTTAIGNTLFKGPFADRASSPENSPFFIPAAVGVGAVGVGGGWKLTDWLLQKRRKSQMQTELDDARREYQDALLSGQKQAGADELDAAFDVLEKRGWGVADSVNNALGGYLTAVGLATAGAGYGTYKWTKSRGQGALLNKALEERARQLWSRTQQPVYAVPKPVLIPDEEQPAAA